MNNAVIYARYSSHNQREESIDGQLRKCHQYAKDHHLNVIAEYCDRAISGRTDNRTEFQKMISDAQKGRFGTIIMYTLDRFARNRYDAATYKAKLKKSGVSLVYTEQEITKEPEGIILESVLEGMAEYYSQNLARGVTRGMRENALKAESNGGVMPLGYKRGQDGKYEIEPEGASLVRYIYESYASGKSQKQIVLDLNREGHRTSRNTPFTYRSLDYILHNPRYYGLFHFMDVTIENGNPAIVSKELWDKCQATLKHTKRKPGNFKTPVQYMLTGKLVCGLCGGSIVGESGTGRSKRSFHYYKCLTRKRARNCSKKTIKKEVLEKLVVDTTAVELLTEDNIERIATRTVQIANKDDNRERQTTALQKEIKRLNEAISRLLNLVSDGVNIPDVSNKLNELDRSRTEAQLELDQIMNSQPVKITKEDVIKWLNGFVTGDHRDPEYQQQIIDTLVNQVILHDDHVLIGYNLTEKKTSKISLETCSELSGMVGQSVIHPNQFIVDNVLFIKVDIPNR